MNVFLAVHPPGEPGGLWVSWKVRSGMLPSSSAALSALPADETVSSHTATQAVSADAKPPRTWVCLCQIP